MRHHLRLGVATCVYCPIRLQDFFIITTETFRNQMQVKCELIFTERANQLGVLNAYYLGPSIILEGHI